MKQRGRLLTWALVIMGVGAGAASHAQVSPICVETADVTGCEYIAAGAAQCEADLLSYSNHIKGQWDAGQQALTGGGVANLAAFGASAGGTMNHAGSGQATGGAANGKQAAAAILSECSEDYDGSQSFAAACRLTQRCPNAVPLFKKIDLLQCAYAPGQESANDPVSDRVQAQRRDGPATFAAILRLCKVDSSAAAAAAAQDAKNFQVLNQSLNQKESHAMAKFTADADKIERSYKKKIAGAVGGTALTVGGILAIDLLTKKKDHKKSGDRSPASVPAPVATAAEPCLKTAYECALEKLGAQDQALNNKVKGTASTTGTTDVAFKSAGQDELLTPAAQGAGWDSEISFCKNAATVPPVLPSPVMTTNPVLLAANAEIKKVGEQIELVKSRCVAYLAAHPQ